MRKLHLWLVVGSLALSGCDASGGAASGDPADAAVNDPSGTDMMGTDMMGTDMMGTDMMGTDMMGTDMSGTDMTSGAAAPPAPASYSGGMCPTFTAGSQTFTSGDMEREITVTLPPLGGAPGVLFLWHGFGDTHQSFSDFANAVGATQSNVITVTPAAALDPFSTDKLSSYKELASGFGVAIPPTWSILDGPEMDLMLFDDLLACLDEQFGIDRSRVYSMGFSQGAIWTGVLAMERSEYIAAAVAWSGGLGTAGGLVEVVNLEYQSPARKIPVLAASGGASDIWPNPQLTLVDFQTGTEKLSELLREDGHATVFCNHGLGHTVPQDGPQWAAKFLFDHTWTPEGESPYYGYDGAGFPGYCTFN